MGEVKSTPASCTESINEAAGNGYIPAPESDKQEPDQLPGPLWRYRKD
jgi:hypothetical protein